ncbi:4-hydroxyphenylpyruvate dioxygenase-like protein isoform X2 [Apostichopus japonicus]
MVGLAVHHIQLAVTHGPVILAKLKQAGFKIFAQSSYSNVRQWAMQSGTARLLVTEMMNPENGQSHQNVDRKILNGQHLPILDPSIALPQSVCKNSISSHSVFNIAFEPSDIEKTLDVARGNGADILYDLRTIDEGGSGFLRYAVIKSGLGNMVHTLLDTSQYRGAFLPGFTNVIDDQLDHSKESHVTHFDHVTLACREGTINETMSWYERCLGMKRFSINRNDDEEQGMVVKETSSGLRLKALEYWRCSEQGLSLTESSQTDPDKPAFVFAEAISGPGPNQIKTFLKEHGCEGVQHVGLYTPNICSAVSCMKSAGLSFISPPVEYYRELAQQQEVRKLGESLQHLQELSILLDTEEDSDCRDIESDRIRYLMQVFGEPLFNNDTFFLELIQREGLGGFGAGNIKALWRAVARHMAQNKAMINSM